MSSSTAMPPSPSLTLILAATPTLGIGKNGALPWPMLKKEMGYFARVTKRVSHGPTTGGDGGGVGGEGKEKEMNAVIMGRKTWESIPPRLRPLKGRVNVVVTRDVEGFRAKLRAQTDTTTNTQTDASAPEGPLVCAGIVDALDKLHTQPQTQGYAIAKIFCIGGASLYTTALELPATKHILLTKIHKEYECDTFFSQDVEASAVWRRAGREEFEEFVGESVEGVVEEQGVEFEFCLFSKVGV